MSFFKKNKNMFLPLTVELKKNFIVLHVRAHSGNNTKT